MSEQEQLKGLGILKVSKEQLEDVSGGHIFNSEIRTGLFSKKRIGSPIDPWEVIDKKGNVVFRATDKKTVISWAKENGYSYNQISWDQVQSARKFYQDHKHENNFEN